MTTFGLSAEGITSGTAVATGSPGNGDSSLSAVVPGTSGVIEYSNTHAAHGSNGVRFSQATAAQTCYIQHTDGADFTAGAFTIYAYITGLPAAVIEWPGRITNAANSAVWSWQLTTTGQLRISSSAGNTTTASTMTQNTYQRIEAQFTNVNSGGSISLQFFNGDSTSPIESISQTGISLANVPRNFRWGRTSTGASLADWWFDDMNIVTGSNTPTGPYVAPTSPGWVNGLSVRVG